MPKHARITQHNFHYLEYGQLTQEQYRMLSEMTPEQRIEFLMDRGALRAEAQRFSNAIAVGAIQPAGDLVFVDF